MLTKAGFKLWFSGMLATLTMSGFGLLFADATEQWPLWEAVLFWVVIAPMVVGLLQRWLWLRGTTQEFTDGA